MSRASYCSLIGVLAVVSVVATSEDNYVSDDGATSNVPNTCPCDYTGPTCIDIGGCHGMRDGNYQSCSCCHGYISCSGGLTYYMPCPANLVWADDKKMCNYTSRTCRECGSPPPPPSPGRCPCLSTGSRCISSCRGLPDGDYQSCHCCHGKQAFITCSNGLTYYMPCPSGLFWADNVKQCNYTSSTCNECTRSSVQEVSTPTTCPCSSTGSSCITSCQGKPDGNYQSCSCCHGQQAFITCSNGLAYNMPCPSGLVWDDNSKLCTSISSTCKECVKLQSNEIEKFDWTKL